MDYNSIHTDGYGALYSAFPKGLGRIIVNQPSPKAAGDAGVYISRNCVKLQDDIDRIE